MASASFQAGQQAFAQYHADWGMFWALAALSDLSLTAQGLDLTADAAACGWNGHMHAMLLVAAEGF